MGSLLGAMGIEIVWLLLAAGFAAGCAYPLYGIIAQEFIILVIVMAMLFAFYFRLVVFFRQVAWTKFLAIQIILFLINPIIFIKALNKIQDVLFLMDSNDLLYFMTPGTAADVYRMNDAFHLFRKEVLLFSIGLLILLVLVELRIALAIIKRVREME